MLGNGFTYQCKKWVYMKVCLEETLLRKSLEHVKLNSIAVNNLIVCIFQPTKWNVSELWFTVKHTISASWPKSMLVKDFTDWHLVIAVLVCSSTIPVHLNNCRILWSKMKKIKATRIITLFWLNSQSLWFKQIIHNSCIQLAILHRYKLWLWYYYIILYNSTTHVYKV